MGCSLLSSSPVTAQSTADEQRIETIEIKGNNRVAAGTVLSYMPLRVGDLVTAGSMNIAIERLYETDLFADISIDMVIVIAISLEGNCGVQDRVRAVPVTMATTRYRFDASFRCSSGSASSS